MYNKRSIVKILFFSSYENRLRSFWRILFVTAILLTSIVVIGLWGFRGYGFTIVLTIVMIGILWLGSRKIDRRPISEYGIRFSTRWLKDFLAGNILAALAMGGIVLIHIAMGWVDISFEQFKNPAEGFYLGLAVTLIFMTAVSFWEETYFRGYLIRNLQEGLHFKKTGKSLAVISAVFISSLLFGLTH